MEESVEMKREHEEVKCEKMRRTRCFLDISKTGEFMGRIVVELFNDVVPKTAENFRALCTGEKGIGPVTGAPLHYKGCRILHAKKHYLIQAGDVSPGNGTGGESIYGLKFDDENFDQKHEKRGALSMANSGPNTNGSEFLITLDRAPHLDGKHVLFGEVVRGFAVVRSVSKVVVDSDDRPAVDVFISGSGEILEGEDDGVINYLKDGDMLPDWPDDLVENSTDLQWWMNAVETIKAFGNKNYEKEDYLMAYQKYLKTLRYLDFCWVQEGIDNETSKSLRSTKLITYRNMCLCKLKLKDAKEALEIAKRVVREGDSSAKAIFLMGKAHWGCNELESALECFKKANEMKSSDEIVRKIKELKIKIEQKRESTRKQYQKMFQ